MRKKLFGLPTIAACGFVAAFYWGTVFAAIPPSAWRMPNTRDAIASFERVRDAMPTVDTFLGIRDVFIKITDRLGK